MENSLLSRKLKELRKAHSYTQDYVAAALGIVRQTYSHYETGSRTPNTENLYKLAGLYNISVDDLIQLTLYLDRNVQFDAPSPTQSGENLTEFLSYLNNPKNQKKYALCSYSEKELLYYFEKLNDDDKQELIEIAKIKTKKK